MSMKVNAKRKRQQTVKIFKKDRTRLVWFGRALTVGAFLFSHWSDKIFESNPHSLLDITGHMDVLLLGIALIFSLVKWFVTLTLAFIDTYISRMSTFKILQTIGGILFPVAVLGHSLWVRHDLYTVPVVTVLLVYFYMHFRSKIGNKTDNSPKVKAPLVRGE